MPENVETKRDHKPAVRFLASSSAASALAALIGASCCILPIVLFNMGIGSAVIAQLGVFTRYRDHLLGAALVLLIVGIGAALWSGRKPSGRAIAVFGLSAATIVAAYLLPSIEADILRFLGMRR